MDAEYESGNAAALLEEAKQKNGTAETQTTEENTENE